MINLPKTNNFITFDPLDPRGHTSVGRFLIEKKKEKKKNSLYMKNNYEKREKVCVCVCVKDNETYRNTIHAENVQKREKTEQRRGFFFLFELNSVNGKHNKT